MKKVFGVSLLVGALTLLAVIPAQADSAYVELSNVSCDAANDSVSFSVVSDGGDYELPVLLSRFKNLDGTTDVTYATGLFEGYFEDNNTFQFEEDFDVGDMIMVSMTLESNDENDELLDSDVQFVRCEGAELVAPEPEPTREVDGFRAPEAPQGIPLPPPPPRIVFR